MAVTSTLDVFVNTQLDALDLLKNGRHKLSELISDMDRDETDISEQEEQLKLLDEKINRFEALIIHFLKRYNLSLDDYRNSRQINQQYNRRSWLSIERNDHGENLGHR